MSNKEWPTEERIDAIGQNGGEGLHYLDVKRQMIEEPTESEMLDWLIQFSNNFDGRNWTREKIKRCCKGK